MNKRELENQYRSVAASTSFAEQQKFIKQLLASNDPETIDYHFSLLKDRGNRNLYQQIRAAFKKRGPSAAEYLIKRAATEKDPQLLGDILHILGTMDRPEALPLARKMTRSSEPDVRDKAGYVLGWLGSEADAEIMAELLLHDPAPMVRADLATAHSQMYERHPKAKDRLLDNLRKALDQETDEEVLAWIIITIQNILHKNFGLRENIEEGIHTGDVKRAKEKAQATLMKRHS
jgi:HEAT repeat protein